VLFELPNGVTDGAYDLIISTYLGSNTVKKAEENNSSAKSEGVVVTTLSGAGITVMAPGNNCSINGGQFVTTGSFSANDSPNRATMTENTTGAVTRAGTIFASGGATGYWYAAFPPLPPGTYTLDVMGGTAVKSITGLTV